MAELHRARDFRRQAERYRSVAAGLGAAGIRDMYLGWAQDLERRATLIEEEAKQDG